MDVKKAFDSVNHKWLTLFLQMDNIPLKITNFIKNTMERWSITLEVKLNNAKESIGPIQLKQGILQGASFCVRLFILCLNPIGWWLRSTEGYSYLYDKQRCYSPQLSRRVYRTNFGQCNLPIRAKQCLGIWSKFSLLHSSEQNNQATITTHFWTMT